MTLSLLIRSILSGNYFRIVYYSAEIYFRIEEYCAEIFLHIVDSVPEPADFLSAPALGSGSAEPKKFCRLRLLLIIINN